MNFLKSLSFVGLAALALGLGAGLVLSEAAPAWAGGLVGFAEALGGLWLNALRMTVIPLIFAVLVSGIAEVSDAAATGRLAVRAMGWFLALLIVSALVSVGLVLQLLAWWPVDAASASALTAKAGGGVAATAPDFGAWLKGLAPSNPIKAAAEDAILPLVVFAAFFGLALTRIPEARGRTLLETIRALGEAMIVIVRWVLAAGPVGVLALGLSLGFHVGAGAAGVVGHYVAIASAAGIATTLLANLFAVTVGRIPPAVWARASGPVLVAAVATQSSLACLPAMIERARDDLGVSERVAGLIPPLAVALFRFTSPAVNLAVCLFIAHVTGAHPTMAQYAGAVLVALAVSVGSVGLPGQVSFIVSVAPICLTLGVPTELLPILLAVEVIPDIFRTTGNVSADMAVTAVLDRAPVGQSRQA